MTVSFEAPVKIQWNKYFGDEARAIQQILCQIAWWLFNNESWLMTLRGCL